MSKIAVVYFSGSGYTHLMAEAIADGAKQIPNMEVSLLRIQGEQIVDGRWKDASFLNVLKDADAIVFGSPTYMGSMAAQFKAFVDACGEVWYTKGWKDKLAGGFTHSGSPSGDKSGTLQALFTNAAQHGMIWISVGEMPAQPNGINRLGSSIGVMGSVPFDPSKQVELDEGDALTAKRYGQRIAEIAAKLN